MEARHDDVTAVTEIAFGLELQHETVWRAVRCVARRTAFHDRRPVLEHEGAELVEVALGALLRFESPEPHAGCGLVWIVAGHALHDAFLEAVVLVKRELDRGGGMTGDAFLRGAPDIAVRGEFVD